MSAPVPKSLFSTQPIVDSVKTPPVVIIGLPRSGSSFLANIVSHIDNWFIFDDLYLYRKAKSINATKGPLEPAQLDELIFFLGWQVRARIKFGIFCKPKMTLDEVDKMDEALKITFQNKSIYWYQLQEEWMSRLSINQGCKYWGYKAPQDFQITDIINSVYTDTRYIFLYRDPRKMLRSFKFVRDHDGQPEQYHPVIYSYYWKKAMFALDKLEESLPDKVLSIKYEELVLNPDDHAKKIADFLNTTIHRRVETRDSNSSFNPSSTENKDITPTEKFICEKKCDCKLIWGAKKPFSHL